MDYVPETNKQSKKGKQGRSLPKKIALIAAPFLILVLAIFGLLAIGIFKPKPDTKDTAPTSTPVVTARAQLQTSTLGVHTQGEARPRSEVNLSAQLNGKIISISPNFLEGGQFKKGDVLVRIEESDYALRVIQAKANVAQAQTALTRELSETEIARKDWEDLGQGVASALSLRKPQLAERRAALASSQAALEEAQLNLSRTVITAPFDGRVSEKSVSKGAYIGAGQSLGRIYGIGVVDIKLPLRDSDLAKLGLSIGFKHSAARPGPDVVLSALVAQHRREWHGRLMRISSRYDRDTRVLYGFVTVKNPYTSGADKGVPLASGMFVDAAIDGRTITQSITVPRTALRGTNSIYIANDDNTLSIRSVEVAASSRARVVITKGLAAGERVITSPVRNVADGMKIQIAKPSSKLGAPKGEE